MEKSKLLIFMLGKNIPGAAHRTLQGLLQLLEKVAGAAASPLHLLYRHKKLIKTTVKFP
jgi:hypothetical protein